MSEELDVRLSEARRLPVEGEIATEDEVGRAWNALDAEGREVIGSLPASAGLSAHRGASLVTRPGQFPKEAVWHMAAIAYEHEEWLKWEHKYLLRREKRWRMRPAHLIAEGIAIGIRLGLAIAEARRGAR